ncbi:MAG TPA: neutral/alkaline non-lysosomal ceramidase N-terminal domain-containing protein [Cytophagaceae bacterium]|nr:neutral/alkaline non-lysosomal ceramidase N-terminal domain-containing protein [Cytophagaceae bacterium]
MKKIIKWIFKLLLGLIVFCLVLLPFLFTKVDRTPYREMPYYKAMMQQLDTFRLDTAAQGKNFKAGWSKKNITPSYYPDLAGYGPREKANCIHDSVYVRAFVFEYGKQKTIFLSADLLIFPPVLEAKLRVKVKELGFDPQGLYLTATHTHSAPGGWAEGPAGRVLAGAYQEKYVDQLLASMTTAIREADNTKEESEIGYGQYKAASLIRNRLNEADSKTDPWVRIMKVRKKSGAQAAIITYAAHANCLKMNYRCVSGDYPAEMIAKLEHDRKIDFALYAAGMVGSHTPKPMYEQNKELFNEPLIHAYGDSLATIIGRGIDSISFQPVEELSVAVLDLPLREPHLKLTEDWRIRPWLFKWFFGPYEPKIKIMKINNVVFMGMPCDFSGELMPDFEQICKEKNIELVITSFNGGYIGYINVDRYYDKDKAETRNMNWFGPYNQAYFTEIVQKILKKI